VGCSPLRLAIFLSLRDPAILTVWKPEMVTAHFFCWLAPQAVARLPWRLLCCPKTAGSLPRPGGTNVSGRPVPRCPAASALHNDAGFMIFACSGCNGKHISSLILSVLAVRSHSFTDQRCELLTRKKLFTSQHEAFHGSRFQGPNVCRSYSDDT